MALTGNLRDLSLASLIQLACSEQLQACLQLQHATQRAQLYFADGNIAHMVLEPADENTTIPTITGEEVLYEILKWDEGAFELLPDVPPPAHSVQGNWSALLLEGMRRLDETQSPPTYDTVEDPVATAALLAELSTVAPNLATQLMQEEKEQSDMTIRRRRSELLAEALSDSLANSSDIEGGALVGIDGLVISANIPIAGLDEALVGAATAAISGLSKRSVEQMKRGEFEQTMIRGSKGYIVVTPVDERSVFVGLTPATANLGMVFVEAREMVQELRNIMMG